ISVLEIELALSQIWLCVPAPQVVVDADARIPLRDLVERLVAAHAIGAVLGDVEMPRDIERGLLPWRERRREIDLHDGAVDARLERRFRAARRDLIQTF